MTDETTYEPEETEETEAPEVVAHSEDEDLPCGTNSCGTHTEMD